MKKNLTPKSGLIIAGSQIDDGLKTFDTVVKFLVVPEEKQQDPTFGSGDRAAIAALADPLRLEMVEAMQKSSKPILFAELKDALDNILFRLAAMEAMRNFNSGDYGADYFSEILKLQSCMGWWPDKGQTRSTHWSLMDPSDVYSAQFLQSPTATPSDAMAPTEANTFPFRGECAGAFQLAVYFGLLNGLGPERFNALGDQFGTMYVGPWKIGKTPNPATLFMASAELSDPPIPGDYMYFQNKDDYLKWAPNGFWTGLNAMYMGKDALGTRHYSGLGAAWLSEANLRISVSDAYYHDCYPHTINDPDKDCRFVMRETLQIPATIQPPAVAAVPAAKALPVSAMAAISAPIADAAGLAEAEAGHFSGQSLRLGDLASNFGFDPGQVKQVASAGKGNPQHRVLLNGGSLMLDYGDPEADRSDPAARVSAYLKLEKA